MFKNLIFQLFKTKGLAKTEKFISARKGVKSAHDFFLRVFSYFVGNGACSESRFIGVEGARDVGASMPAGHASPCLNIIPPFVTPLVNASQWIINSAECGIFEGKLLIWFL